MATEAGDVASWGVAEVTKWLEGLELGGVAPAFKDNAVDGTDLLALTDQDLTAELGCTPLQARKIRNNLARLTGQAAPAPAAAPPAAAATLAPTPVPIVLAAPAPAPVPVAAAAPPAPAAPTIPAADVARYKELSSRIAKLEDIKPTATLADAKRRVQYLEGALVEDRKAIAKFEQVVKEEEGKLSKVEDNWYPGKILMGKQRHEGKVEEQAGELSKAVSNLEGARHKAEATERDLAEARKVAAAWHDKANELKSLGLEKKELVQRIFAAPDWAAHPPLVALQREAAALSEQAGQARQEAAPYGHAEGLLKQADQKIKGALQALKGVQMMGMMEMAHDMRPFAPRRGMMSPMQNMMEMGAVRKANDLVASAAQDVQTARRDLPALPGVSEALLKDAQRGVFASVLLPGVGGDMMQMAAVRKSMESVERMAGEVQQALAWVHAQAGVHTGREASLKGQADAKVAEAEAYKRRQLEQALAGGGGSAPAAAPTPAVSLI